MFIMEESEYKKKKQANKEINKQIKIYQQIERERKSTERKTHLQHWIFKWKIFSNE